MYSYRVTKYNPDDRNYDGYYEKNEWTCPSEIGERFDNVTFKESDYFNIERLYIAAVIDIMKLNGIDHLRIIDLSDAFKKEKLVEKASQWLVSDEITEIELFEDKRLDFSEIEVVIKMVLRGFIDCRLEINEKISVYFGWDFYMHVICESELYELMGKFYKLGIYIEDEEPSYDMAVCEFNIEIVDKNKGGAVEDTVFIEGMTKDKIKQGLGLSEEHTGNHSFLITPENQQLFSDTVAFDFSKNKYYLSCDKIYL